RVDAGGDRRVLLVQLLAGEQAVDDAMEMLRDRALLRTGRLVELLLERSDRSEDLLGRRRHLLELARRQPAVVADGRVADELADIPRVLGRDLRGDADEAPVDEPAGPPPRRTRPLPH